jgi:hypothetical protein
MLRDIYEGIRSNTATVTDDAARRRTLYPYVCYTMLTEQPCAQIQIGDPGILHTVGLVDHDI